MIRTNKLGGYGTSILRSLRNDVDVYGYLRQHGDWYLEGINPRERFENKRPSTAI